MVEELGKLEWKRRKSCVDMCGEDGQRGGEGKD